MLTQCCCLQHDRRLIMQHKGGFYEFLPYSPKPRNQYRRQAFEELALLERAKVVDITFKGDSIYVVAKSAQNVIADPPIVILSALCKICIEIYRQNYSE